jgi:hypothetical protein
VGGEVEKLRAASAKGVQRVRVKDKEKKVDLDTFKTRKDGGEWLEH